MPEWLFGGLVTLAGAVLLAVGTIAGHLLTSRVQKRTVEVQAEANKKTAEQQMIDQLQEELSAHRFTANARSTAQDERMERIERQNIEITQERDKLREYAHDLRGHIFDGLAPPPPDWPDGVTK